MQLVFASLSVCFDIYGIAEISTWARPQKFASKTSLLQLVVHVLVVVVVVGVSFGLVGVRFLVVLPIIVVALVVGVLPTLPGVLLGPGYSGLGCKCGFWCLILAI